MKSKLLAVLVTLLAAFNTLSAQQKNLIDLQLVKLGQSFYNIGNYYIDTVDFTSLADGAMREILSRLDPHSTFIPASEVKAMNEQLEGNFDGIGVEFAIIRDTLTIQGVVHGGPSEKVGLRAGDKIVTVDGEEISGAGLTTVRVHKYLRGEKGTKVSVGILRRGADRVLNFIITRGKIPVNSVDASYMLPGDIRYIKLSRFAADSYKEIMTDLTPLLQQLKGIVLDLRGNGGGYILTALRIANEFLNKGELILYTEGRSMPRRDEFANGFGRLSKLPLAVLIDENSASASEIVAGAIQDWDRGLIIGRRSFGKGLVQRQFDLADGSQMRLTIARYHTPSGRVIQSPYREGDAAGYYRQFYERYSKGEYTSRDSIHLPDSLKFYTLVNKRVVYGNGGIMPDIFIPADTSYFSEFYSNVVRKGVIVDFVNEYTDKKRDELVKISSDSDEFANYMLTNTAFGDGLFEEFRGYALKRGISYDSERDGNSGNEIVKQLEGLILRNMFNMTAYFKHINRTDPEVQRAIAEIAR